MLIVTNGNAVQGNLIGTNASGNVGLFSSSFGINIKGGSNNTLGGATAAARNVISGNNGDGVWIFGPGTGNLVQGNSIGTDVTGTAPLPNKGRGVHLGVPSGAGPSSDNNTIGGTTTSASNVIAFNDGDGVFVESGTGNAILGNSIFSNGGLGIDLGSDGVTPNDPGDVDSGANLLQNFPVIEAAEIHKNGSVLVRYVVDSVAGSSTYPILVEFFAADADGQEGRTFLASDVYETADAQIAKVISLGGSTALGVNGGDLIVATATDADGNTSEFSQASVVDATGVALPGLTQWGLIVMAVLVGAVLSWRRRVLPKGMGA